VFTASGGQSAARTATFGFHVTKEDKRKFCWINIALVFAEKLLTERVPSYMAKAAFSDHEVRLIANGTIKLSSIPSMTEE